MSITLTNFRAIVDNRLGASRNRISSTTTAAGATDKTTAIDTSLSNYPDDYFKGWTFYVSGQTMGKVVERFNAPDGVFTFYNAFTSQISSSVAYTLHKFNMDDVKTAINQALIDVYPADFYKRLYDTTLFGQTSYNESPNEYDKYIYTVPSTFEEFPYAIWLLDSYIGEHTGDDDASTLTDSNASWTTDELVGFTIYNKTDGSSGTVTANTSTTVTATLAGGTGNNWDEDDEYIVQKPDVTPKELKTFTVIDRGYIGAFSFHADIPENYIIALEGKQPLSQYTTEAGTTELTDEQAHVVALKAIANLYSMYTTHVDSDDAERFNTLAREFELKYFDRVKGTKMPSLWKPRIIWK
jgi:hypothetical protein